MTRHDAYLDRQHAKSERIRHEQGILTPAEREAKARAEDRRRREAQRKAQQGLPLEIFGDEL